MAKAVAGELIFKMSTDVAELRRGVAQATSTLEGFQARVEKIGSAIGTAFAAIGAGLAVGAGIEKFRQFLDIGDRLDEVSQQVGVSVEALQILQTAAARSSVDADALTKSLVKLSVTLNKALADSTSKQADLFNALGVNLDSVKNSADPVAEAVAQLADRFKEMPDGIEKTAAAAAIGKAGFAALIPVLNGGRDALEEVAKELGGVGAIMSGETAQAAGEFNDQLDKVHKITVGLGYALANELLPPLREAIDDFLEWAKTSDNLSGALGAVGAVARDIAAFIKEVAAGAAAVVEVYRGLRQIASGVADVGRTIVNWTPRPGALEATAEGVSKGFEAIEAGATAVGEATFRTIQPLDELNASMDGAYEKATKLGSALTEVSKKTRTARFTPPDEGDEETAGGRKRSGRVGRVGKAAAAATPELEDLDKLLFGLDEIEAKTAEVEDSTKDVVNIYATLEDAGSSAFNSIADAITTLATTGKLKFSELATSIIGDLTRIGLNSAFSAIKDLATKGIESGGGLSGIFSSIGSLFAGLFRMAGGPVVGGRPYIVGEAGPELFIPGAGGMIAPNGSWGGRGVIINNQGPPLVVRSIEERQGDIRIAVAAATQAVETKYSDSMRTGYGTYARSLAQNTTARRR